MKTVSWLVLTLLLALGGWLLLRDGSEEAPPPPAQQEADALPGARPAEPASERTGAAAPAAASPATAPSAAAPPAAQPEPGTLAEPPNFELHARSLTTNEPLAAFRWSLRGEAGTTRGTGALGHANAVLPPGAQFDLLVEADGHAPFARPAVQAPAPGQPALSIEAFLAPAALAAGITLHVHDTARQPIARIRVAAHVLRGEERDGPWHLVRPLWSRVATAADGRYVLPELAPGEYGVRVLAIDATGELLPLRPFVRTFVLTGSNGFVEDATLEPGCLPQLHLVDAAGQEIDPAGRAVTLSLRLPGGPAVQRQWLQRRDQKTFAAEDQLPGPGPCWPAEPVAAGAWTFEVLIDGQLRLQQPLVLRAGERQPERLIVP